MAEGLTIEELEAQSGGLLPDRIEMKRHRGCGNWGYANHGDYDAGGYGNWDGYGGYPNNYGYYPNGDYGESYGNWGGYPNGYPNGYYGQGYPNDYGYYPNGYYPNGYYGYPNGHGR